MKRGKAAIFIRLSITRYNYSICLKCLGLFERFEIAPLKVKFAAELRMLLVNQDQMFVLSLNEKKHV